MRKSSSIIPWVVAAAAGTLLLIWGHSRAAPFQPRHWRTSASQAEAIVLEHLRQLGQSVRRPYVVTRFSGNALLERRLQLSLAHQDLARLRATGLPDLVTVWEVTVYPPEATRSDYAAKAEVSLTGGLVSLHLRVDPEAKAAAALAPAAARGQADALLRAQGFDLRRFAEPEISTQQLASRTDVSLRYRDRRQLPDGGGFGIEVKFAGDRLSDFGSWIDAGAPQRAAQRSLQESQLALFGAFGLNYGSLAVLALPFLKRYHEGEIGVRRGTQLFLLIGASGLLLMAMIARAQSAAFSGFSFSTPQQGVWFWMLIFVLFYLMPAALLAFLAWSVGEWWCRRPWGHKLASFDALFQRKWGNVTVAASSLRGILAGPALAGLAVAMLLAVRPAGAWPMFALFHNMTSGWTGLEVAAGYLVFLLPVELVLALCVLPVLGRWLGRPLGFLATVLVAAVGGCGPILVLPLGWGLLPSAVFMAAQLGVFLALDLLAFLLAGLTSAYLFVAWPLLTAVNPALRAEGWAGLLILATPLVLSARYLGSRREIVYRYEDVPPHVRRIAERERQRVELETARRIQSSILPELPPRLAGVDLAHAYLPASEVGGDFYDVLALEDGRLAVAVGDVAGHGVSSGLVMSMAKSALAVQVTFDPEVESVFRTMNRTVYQTARKRLLTTFCYALLDPVRRELLYASAGHLYPYRITAAGRVEALESTGYPLGVRRTLEVEPRLARLGAGDALFLFSDGLVEARAEGSDDLFGFERLEESLGRHAGGSVESLRDGVLADVVAFTRGMEREDDVTVVVLRLPPGASGTALPAGPP
ncbi:MAG TPA: PP2C family protein-serine/threonine phosphatase [Thermoanaerobaculia bacterium]|nr:PP2C family protein-serine/threonine phosphatase [Thermoanaerobaculia bacterium]